MNVNPLNTIPGQNTATRGSESGQIRYRGEAGPADGLRPGPGRDPAGCSSVSLPPMLSFSFPLSLFPLFSPFAPSIFLFLCHLLSLRKLLGTYLPTYNVNGP